MLSVLAGADTKLTDLQGIVIQQASEIMRSWVAYGEIARILITCEGQLFKLPEICFIGNDTHCGNDLKIAIIEQI